MIYYQYKRIHERNLWRPAVPPSQPKSPPPQPKLPPPRLTTPLASQAPAPPRAVGRERPPTPPLDTGKILPPPPPDASVVIGPTLPVEYPAPLVQLSRVNVALDSSAVQLVTELSELPLSQEVPLECHPRTHTDIGGSLASDVLAGHLNLKTSAAECCKQCKEHLGEKRCNTWVYNTISNECWLKTTEKYAENPPTWSDGVIPWTAGTLFDFGPVFNIATISGALEQPPTCITTVVTTNGDDSSNWQTRILYKTWLSTRAAESETLLQHFVRVLHRTTPDALMEEVPTVRVDPLRPECDGGCDFVVADRADALTKFSLTPEAARCSHILMIEPDFLFIKPIPRQILPSDGHSIGYVYSYVDPSHADIVNISKQYYAGDLIDVPRTGNSPQLMTVSDFKRITPIWSEFTARIEKDEQARIKMGGLRDMYSYSFAAASTKIRHHIASVPYQYLIVQPPADSTLGQSCLIHYTAGAVIRVDNTVVWEFDKRRHTVASQKPAAIANLPPYSSNMVLENNANVTENVYKLILLLQNTFNSALKQLN